MKPGTENQTVVRQPPIAIASTTRPVKQRTPRPQVPQVMRGVAHFLPGEQNNNSEVKQWRQRHRNTRRQPAAETQLRACERRSLT
jgi:hypothetical protein